MVDIKRVVFGVAKTGSGQPDYAQPEALATTENTLVVKYPETEVSANRFDDYAELTVTTAQVEYVVGTNANAEKAGSWDSGILARSIDFYASADVFVRFNYANAVQHEVPAELLKNFTKRAEKVFVQAKSRTANVKMWIEG